MRRLLWALLAVVLVCSMSFPAFAAEENKEQDVTVKYIITVEGEYRAEIKNGTAAAEGVTVTGAPANTKTLVVVPIPSSVSEAYEWFSECLEKIGKPLAAYEVYFLDVNDNRISADGATISIAVSGNKDLTVCSLTAGGDYKDLSAEIKNGSAVFTANDGDYFILTEKKSDEPKPGGNVTVPVRGDDHELHADATVDGDTVDLHELDFDEIDRIIGDKDKDGLIEIDLTELDEDVCKIILPVTSVEHIISEAEETHNEHEALQVDFPHGSVKLDDKTMRAIVEQAECNEVILVLEDVGETRLNEKQENAVKDWNVYGGYEAYLLCVKANKRISDFEGGVATMYVPFTLPEGVSADKISVWHIADDGTKEKMNTSYENGVLTWEVGHFSDFIIATEKSADPGTDPIEPTEPNLAFLWWLIPVSLVTLVGGGFAIYWFVIKKKTWADLVAIFRKSKENEE